ncbi:MAG TPA: zinc-dependent metalloprotease [Longimicrobiales bacterium]|nr:zinc-dependent metalloprotease [Longimicrobiales bacterium]
MKRQMTQAVVLLAALSASACASASAASPTPQAGPSQAAQRNGGGKTIAEVTKDSRRLDGLFTLFQDTLTGSTHMRIDPDQVGSEFIYWAHIADGVVDAGAFRGAFRDNEVFTVERDYDRVRFVIQPTHLYFDPAEPLSRAADANVSPAVVAAEDIVARDAETGAVLIKADNLFLGEVFAQVKPSSQPGPQRGFSLGQLSKSKTRYVDLRNYPENTAVVVDYVYDNPAPTAGGSSGVVSPRSVTIRMQHTLIAMPKNGYRPRFEDPRVGFFTDRQTDMLSTSPTPYRDLINRWSLVKKDPGAAISEPVEPIVWWIENTTPEIFRETIRDALLHWNRAFETAGFRNAVEVRVQPDDADWDAGDIRYNVVRWTSSPNPPFGGYGPSFTNPRTGQILGADIMLEYTFVTNRIPLDRVFETAALGLVEPFDPDAFTGAEAAGACAAGAYLHNAALFGAQALRAAGVSEADMTDFIRQSIHYLVLHEVGHTLGLNHNMKGTQLWSPAEAHDRARTSQEGLYSSVMDYPAVNLARPGQTQGEYWISTVGPYDHWAIQFGYDPRLDDDAAMAAHLARSTDPRLVFGNDADDMRAPGKAIDPRVNIYDMSSDAIGYAAWLMEHARGLQTGLLERYEEPGSSYHALRNAYMILTGQQAIAGGVISRYIGGVYVDRGMQGQPGHSRPFTPVSRADQKRAMAALSRSMFAPDAWRAPSELAAHLAMQRRGFDFFAGTEDPKLHDRALNAQRGVLAHLLHPAVLQRITDTRLYGNEYPLAEMLTDLTDAIFAADRNAGINTFRQNLQVEYVNRLAGIIRESETNRYDHVSRGLALANLQRIDTMMAGRTGNAETRAHAQHVRHIVRKAVDAH